jgi:hypothetical protein
VEGYSFQTHSVNKVSLHADHLYIMCPKRGQARLEPALGINKIPTNTSLEDLVNTQQSEDVWVTYFGTCLARQSETRVVTGLDPSDNFSLWEVVDTPRIESYG